MKEILDIRYYTIKEIAEMLGITTISAYELVKKGDIKAKKICNKLWIPESEIVNFMNIRKNVMTNQVMLSYIEKLLTGVGTVVHHISQYFLIALSMLIIRI
jgi:excisionase family DNA binding protein